MAHSRVHIVFPVKHKNSSVCSRMKQSNARVSSRSAADSKHGVRQQRKPCHQSSDSFLVRPSHSYSTSVDGHFAGTATVTTGNRVRRSMSSSESKGPPLSRYGMMRKTVPDPYSGDWKCSVAVGWEAGTKIGTDSSWDEATGKCQRLYGSSAYCVQRKGPLIFSTVSWVFVFQSSRFSTEIFLDYALRKRHSSNSPHLCYVQRRPWYASTAPAGRRHRDRGAKVLSRKGIPFLLSTFAPRSPTK